MNNPSRSLLFTRPQGQGEDLVQALDAAGWHCVRQPLLKIMPFTPQQGSAFQAIKSNIMNLDRYDVVISVSGNASAQAVEWIDQYWPQMPQGIHWLAVGPSSAAAFKALGIEVATPPGNHSEGLLALPALQQMAHKKVLILRGQGGRELLANTLRERGAEVDYCELYQRQAIPFAAGQLATLLRERQIHYALITSGEMAEQLAQQLPSAAQRLDLQLIVPSKRIQDMATTLGFSRVAVCGHIQAATLLACLNALPA
ncbi:MAG: uroporphyrinogen-III synthase [Bermanella sp.]